MLELCTPTILIGITDIANLCLEIGYFPPEYIIGVLDSKPVEFLVAFNYLKAVHTQIEVLLF